MPVKTRRKRARKGRASLRKRPSFTRISQVPVARHILRKMRKTECPTRATGWVPAIHRRFQLIRLLRVRQMHNPSVSVPRRRPIPPGVPYPYSPARAESDGVFPDCAKRACGAEARKSTWIASGAGAVQVILWLPCRFPTTRSRFRATVALSTGRDALLRVRERKGGNTMDGGHTISENALVEPSPEFSKFMDQGRRQDPPPSERGVARPWMEGGCMAKDKRQGPRRGEYCGRP